MIVTFNQFMPYDSEKYGNFMVWANTLTNGITYQTLQNIHLLHENSISSKLWEAVAPKMPNVKPIGKFENELVDRFPMHIIIGYMSYDEDFENFKEEYNSYDSLKRAFDLNSLEMIADEIADSDMSNDEIFELTGSRSIELVRNRKLNIHDLPICELEKFTKLRNGVINLENVQKLIDSDISAYNIEAKTGVSRTTISQIRNGKTDLMNMKGTNLLRLSDFAKFLIRENEL